MDQFRQDLIEAVIIGGAQSHHGLAVDVGRSSLEVLEELKRLKSDGLVIETHGDSIELAELYAFEHPRMRPDSAEDYEYGPTGVKWRYCGGPISKALEVPA